jgi:hypothetical protein
MDINSIKDGAAAAFNSAKEAVTNVVEDVKEGAEHLVDQAQDKFEDIKEDIQSGEAKERRSIICKSKNH